MSSYKYTGDGKKVVIVGQLNSNETIVQEIFISNGSEVPSGENFVVKSLHDDPVVSWKEDKAKKMDDLYETTRLKHDAEMKTLRFNHKHASATLKALLKSTESISNNLDNEAFKTMVMFLTGEITHVVKAGWCEYEILDFNKTVSQNDSFNSEIKLITLFGKEKCGFNWKINQYSDGSGSNVEIHPCRSYENAKLFLEEFILDKLENDNFDLKMVDAKNKYGLSIPSVEQINKFYEKEIISKRNFLLKRKTEDEKILAEIADLASKINGG